MLLSRQLLQQHLDAQRAIASLAPALSQLAVSRALLANIAAVDFTHLRQPILDAQMLASASAWTATVTRLNAAALNLAAMQPAIAGLSEVLALRLQAVRQPGSWLKSITLPPAALGIHSADLRVGLLEPLVLHLRAMQRSELEKSAIGPAAFATLAASGVAGTVSPEQPSTSDSEAVIAVRSEEIRASGIELLRRRHPELIRKLDGARQAILSGNVDGVSQASNSLQEFTDHTLRRLTDPAAASEWCRAHYPQGIYKKDSEDALTRAAKVRYIAHLGGFDGTVPDSVATIVTAASQILQKGKHDEVPREIMESLLLVVEGYVGAIIVLMGD